MIMNDISILKLRTITTLIAAFKAQDANTTLTEHPMHYFIDIEYIHAPKVGSKYGINLDELIDALNTPNNEVRKYGKPCGNGVKSMAEIVAMFNMADKETLMCKSLLRSMRRDGQISVIESSRQWFIVDGLLAKFGAYAPSKAGHSGPLLRTLEESEPTLHLSAAVLTNEIHNYYLSLPGSGIANIIFICFIAIVNVSVFRSGNKQNIVDVLTYANRF